MSFVPTATSDEAQPGPNVGRIETDDGRAEVGPESLPRSQLFELLSNARRRRVLKVLREQGGSTTLGEVAEIVAAWENDKDVSELTSSERKRTYVGLYQCHLPKMDDSEVVEFDKYRGDIQLGPNAPLMFEYLEDEGDERDRRWAKHYLALSGGWGGIFLLGGLGGFEVLTSPAAIGIQLLTFALYSIAYYRAADDADEAERSPVSLVETDAGRK